MRSMVEGLFGVGKAPPPRFARSPSPEIRGRSFSARQFEARTSVTPR